MIRLDYDNLKPMREYGYRLSVSIMKGPEWFFGPTIHLDFLFSYCVAFRVLAIARKERIVLLAYKFRQWKRELADSKDYA